MKNVITLSDTRFTTAKEKEIILKHFKRFISREFHYSFFTKKLFRHLSYYCDMDPYLPRLEFYTKFFTSSLGKCAFSLQFNTGYTYRTKDSSWMSDDYGDLHKEMCKAVRELGL